MFADDDDVRPGSVLPPPAESNVVRSAYAGRLDSLTAEYVRARIEDGELHARARVMAGLLQAETPDQRLLVLVSLLVEALVRLADVPADRPVLQRPMPTWMWHPTVPNLRGPVEDTGGTL